MALQPDEVTHAARAVLARYPEIRLGLLFGSVARSEAHEQSDADVAVSGAAVDLPALAAQLSLAVGTEVDVISLDDDLPIELLRELLRDALCIYEAEPGAEAAFRARALWSVETDGPSIDRMARAYVKHVAAREPE